MVGGLAIRGWRLEVGARANLMLTKMQFEAAFDGPAPDQRVCGGAVVADADAGAAVGAGVGAGAV